MKNFIGIFRKWGGQLTCHILISKTLMISNWSKWSFCLVLKHIFDSLPTKPPL